MTCLLLDVEDDPCSDGLHSCTDDHMACVGEGTRHRCICREGYNMVYDNQLHHQQGRCVGKSCRRECRNAACGYSLRPDSCVISDIDECTENIHRCSPNAICRNEPGTYACLCRTGFEGDGYRCTERKLNCQDVQCHSDADCQIDSSNNPICVCRSGFEGNGYVCRRIEASNPCKSVRCDPNAQCVIDALGAPTCACNEGYTGDGYMCNNLFQQPEIHIDARVSEPQRTCESVPCPLNSHCRYDNRRQPVCVCDDGYEGDGRTCQKKAMPAENVKLCSSHEECGDTAYCAYNDQHRRYQCKCRPTFTGDGVNCLPERRSCDVAHDCHVNADCFWQQDATEVGYKCRCRSGFTGDGYKCEEIKKQDVSCNVLNNCHPNAKCNYSPHTNAYVCQCEAGYSGDGNFCSKVETDANHKCKSSEDCHSNAHCVFRDSAYEYFCECLPGYRGDGFSNCDPADECFPGNENTGCGELAKCSFDLEKVAYVCKCIGGYTGDGHTCVPEVAISCNTDPTLCHYNAECRYSSVTSTYACHCREGFKGDGYNSCEKEQVTCRMQNICDPNAGCHPTSDGTTYICICNRGYEGDGFTCQPIHDCMLEPNLCHENAVCVSENMRYVCRCKEGYHGSGQKCTSDSELNGKILIFSQGMSLVQRGMLASDIGKQIVIAPYQIAVGIDYDCANGQIYWTDVSGHSVRKANLDGSGVSVVYDAELNSPEGIALDWLSHNIYYADSSKKEIGVITMDGKYRYTVLTNGLVNPRALAIDHIEKKIYFSDWHRQQPQIGRFNLDGTDRESFVSDGIALPNGLVVLHRRREVCWADAGTQRLECIGVNKAGRRKVYDQLKYPFGLTAADEEMFYWTDWEE
ncbi:unnamed protein product [Soboliphyme baturini]|uniref:EGF-like domain-containing protein n=1 Tax=Soboliphyme baturini TaxID=241478 RepID=A0A183IQG2_9BILA|nr:unnamed protein product [Soboliphyme baturini]